MMDIRPDAERCYLSFVTHRHLHDKRSDTEKK